MSGNPSSVLYACLTHVPLEVDYPDYVTPIYMGEAQGLGRLNLRDLAPEWEPHHPVLGSIAGAFALKNLLLQRPGVTHVGICQYRKFMTRERIGVQADNYQVMDVLSTEQIDRQVLSEQMLPQASDYLIGKPGQFTLNGVNHGYLYQYKDVHHIEDLLRFTAVAVELGVLDRQEVIPFFDEKIFFPGGIELGVLPADFWLPHISAVEAVVRRCVELHPTQRPDVQARVWAFCAERLGSYYLLRQLRRLPSSNGDWLSRHTGQLNLLVKSGERSYVPGV
ncbi:hypothetical protein [Pseudomonas sp. SO81]|uniref:hypothetical protein n=1 Tax=Pseudomonas sp. SO81 TaxID=2983246 RepID=UPI0025A37036|nr:hypothetical protein [Pseudomonas sp. SO81]WJN59983.1 hypothetical protein OH686_14610 [Pseudomonas sp. SO81]